MEIRDKDIVNWPYKLRGNKEHGDRKKYCHFYYNLGHDTEDCRTLKDEVETLILRGYLNKYKRENCVK